MNSQYTIQKELKDLGSSLPLEKKEIYTIPDGYFENLAATVLSKIKGTQPIGVDEELENLSALIASIPRKMPFSVPDNYFNQNSNELSRLAQQDFLPPFLAEHNRKMPFEVPTGYFEKLSVQVVSSITKPQAKVISFGAKRWMKYASAAIITGIIALGGFFYFQDNKPSIDPVKQPHEWVAKKLQNVSNQDLEQFINTTDISISTNNQQIARKGNMDVEVRTMLRNVSTTELGAFLSEVPAETDEFSVIN